MLFHAPEETLLGAPTRSAGRLLRLRVLLARPRLDQRLAAGEPVDGDPALAVRAAQLRSPRTREYVAAALERALADDGRRGLTAAIPMDAQALRAARPVLEDLVAALRAPVPVEARGVALVQRLLTDGVGPLYMPTAPNQLVWAATEAHRALAAGDPRWN